jgi:hypothetical protein
MRPNLSNEIARIRVEDLRRDGGGRRHPRRPRPRGEADSDR